MDYKDIFLVPFYRKLVFIIVLLSTTGMVLGDLVQQRLSTRANIRHIHTIARISLLNYYTLIATVKVCVTQENLQ